MNHQTSGQTSFFCPLPGSCVLHRKPYSIESAQQAFAELDSQRDYKRALMELKPSKATPSTTSPSTHSSDSACKTES